VAIGNHFLLIITVYHVNWFVYFIAAVNPKETLASLALQRLPKFICNTSKANED
jgi:hypothetical protein